MCPGEHLTYAAVLTAVVVSSRKGLSLRASRVVCTSLEKVGQARG